MTATRPSPRRPSFRRIEPLPADTRMRLKPSRIGGLVSSPEFHVMEYLPRAGGGHGVNVHYDVYRIRTQISEAGAKVDRATTWTCDSYGSRIAATAGIIAIGKQSS